MVPKSSIGTLEQAIKILELVVFGEKGGLTLKEVTEKTGLHSSTVYRYLNTFLQFGYLKKEPTGLYKPGIKLLELGNHVLNSFDLREIAHPYLVELVNRVNQTAHLAIREGDEALYIDKVEGPKTLQMRSRVGMRVPLYCTALGKILLAYSDKEDVDRYLREVELKPRAQNTITSSLKLKEELSRVKQQGYAIDNQENEQGIVCVGAPIFDFTGQAVAALSVSGFFKDFSGGKIKEIISHLRKTTALISKGLGGSLSQGA